MDFEKLLSELEAGNVDQVKQQLTAFKPTFEATVSELKAYEGKFAEAVTTRDKAKGRLKELSESIGIGLDELSWDKVKELLSSKKGDDASKAEIENLTKLLSAKEGEFNQRLQEAESKYSNTLIEGEIAKLGSTFDVVNDKAMSLVIQALKDGATIEEGAVVYRNQDGTIIRNNSGRPLTVSERMAEFKADTANAFLFKATNNGGGGSASGNGGGNYDGGKIPLDGDKQARLNAIKNKFLKG